MATAITYDPETGAILRTATGENANRVEPYIVVEEILPFNLYTHFIVVDGQLTAKP